MKYRVGLMDELILDQLSGNSSSHIVRHLYWLPDEAASLYQHAFCCGECGMPAFYLMQREYTHKGDIWTEILGWYSPGLIATKEKLYFADRLRTGR